MLPRFDQLQKRIKIKIAKGTTGILVDPEKVKILREYMASGGNLSSAFGEVGVRYGTIFLAGGKGLR